MMDLIGRLFCWFEKVIFKQSEHDPERYEKECGDE